LGQVVTESKHTNKNVNPNKKPSERFKKGKKGDTRTKARPLDHPETNESVKQEKREEQD